MGLPCVEEPWESLSLLLPWGKTDAWSQSVPGAPEACFLTMTKKRLMETGMKAQHGLPGEPAGSVLLRVSSFLGNLCNLAGKTSNRSLVSSPQLCQFSLCTFPTGKGFGSKEFSRDTQEPEYGLLLFRSTEGAGSLATLHRLGLTPVSPTVVGVKE